MYGGRNCSGDFFKVIIEIVQTNQFPNNRSVPIGEIIVLIGAYDRFLDFTRQRPQGCIMFLLFSGGFRLIEKYEMTEINGFLGRQSQGVAEFFYTGPRKVSLPVNNMFEKGRGIYFHLFREITVGKVSGAPFAFLIVMKKELSVVYKFKYCFHKINISKHWL